MVVQINENIAQVFQHAEADFRFNFEIIMR